MKAKIAEAEGRLMCMKCQNEMQPNEEGKYDFENWGESSSNWETAKAAMAEEGGDGEMMFAEDEVVDLMDFDMNPDEEEKIKKSLMEKTKFKEVAPTWELNIENYGYGAKRKAYDPDYEHVENSKYREYERLEAGGYEEGLVDQDDNTRKQIKAPGLGHKHGKYTPGEKKFTTSDYLIAPKVPQMNPVGPVPGKTSG